VLYYCIVVTVLTPQPRKPHTCNNTIHTYIHTHTHTHTHIHTYNTYIHIRWSLYRFLELSCLAIQWD